MGIIENIVSTLHVGTSNRQVIHHVVSKAKGGRKGYFRHDREVRHSVLRQALRAHRDNRNLYHAVTTGRLL